MKQIMGAVQADADICNLLTVDPPLRGVHVGPGLHVVIPSDWQARCVSGQVVPGCNCTRIVNEGAASLIYVSEKAEANQAIPANILEVNATVLLAFRAKLLTAIDIGQGIPG